MCDEETTPSTTVSQGTPILRDVIIIYLLSSFLYLFSSLLLARFGDQIQEKYLLISLLFSQLVFVVAPPVLYTIWHNYNVSRTFQITPIPFKAVWLTIITTGAASILIGILAIFQQKVLPHSQDYREFWEQVLQQFQQTPFILTFALVAILPGICEELFFRGFLLQGIRKKFSDRFSIVLVGVLFGLLHFDPYRFFSVTLLGIFFGYLVVKTGSIFPGMIAHITNNTLVLLLLVYATQKVQESSHPLSPPLPEDLPLSQLMIALLPLLVIALTVFIVGLRAIPQISESEEQGMRFEKQEMNFKDRKPQNKNEEKRETNQN
jgi:membrane protease YdiL (CAAX protease family)